MTMMVRVELGGESREVPEVSWMEAADELVAKYGGVPRVTPITTPEPPALFDMPPGAHLGATELPAGEVTAAQIVDAINAGPEPVVASADPNGQAITVRALGVIRSASPGLGLTMRTRPRGLSMGAPLEVEAGRMDLIGQARSTIDAEEATAAGFAVAAPLYDRGTRVNDLGVENAQHSRQEWEAMPLVLDNCEAHAAQIQAEDRQDDVALVTMTRMQDDGTYHATHVDNAPGSDPSRYTMTEDAFAALVTRMKIPAAGRYLRQCWPELRATNVNGWLERLEDAEAKASAAARVAERAPQYTPLDMRLRHRVLSRPRPELEGHREIFGIVGPAYADFDADKIDEALALAVPAGARGRVTYDGRRSRWEILFQSTVQPQHFVAGEFFRAGVVITTDDAGGGAVTGRAVAWQNLCLNLIIVQTTTTAEFSIRHVGEVDALARKFKAGFGKALGAIDHFVKAWDYAVEDDVVRRVRQIEAANGRALPASPEQVMAGIFRDTIERELVPVRGIKTEKAVDGLMRAWGQDTSGAAGTTRAAVANAFTRWAHSGLDADPWAEDEIQAGAGALIRRTKRDDGWATSLGYMATEDVEV